MNGDRSEYHGIRGIHRGGKTANSSFSLAEVLRSQKNGIAKTTHPASRTA
jgi:hypothetical protein